MMMKRAFAKLLLVLLLLAGQQSALVHSVWHIQDRLPAQEQHDHATAAQENGDEHSSQSRLCDLHGVLGALLAGDCGGQPSVVAAAVANLSATYAATWRFSYSATTPPSRAPPAFS